MSSERFHGDMPIEDSVTLTTVAGGELLVQDAALRLPAVAGTRVRPGAVDFTWRGSLGVLRDLPLVQGLQIQLSVDDLIADLRRSADVGVLAALEGEPLRFRVGATLLDGRAELIDTLQAELGWVNSASDWDVNLEFDGNRIQMDVGALHWNRRFLALERQSFSTPTAVATVLARISRLEPGNVVLDPFCGSATNLVASAVTVSDVSLLGTDINPGALALGEINVGRLRGIADVRSSRLVRASADELPFEDSSVDRVISNMPFGKRVGSHAENVELYPRSLQEIARVLTSNGRVVMLTEDKRLFEDSVARTRGIKIVSTLVLRYGGATPTAYSIKRSRR